MDDKYHKALDLVHRLETERGSSDWWLESLTAYRPADLYRYLFDEWWREWNGILNEWQYREGFSPEEIYSDMLGENDDN